MATSIEMIEKMQSDAEKARAAAKDGSKAFVGNSIVLLAEGQRALVRPVYNMSESIVIPMHDKYKNTDVSLSSRTYQGATQAAPISSMCATHIGKPCLFCAQPKEAKLEARMECFVPVYLYGIKDSQDNTVTFTDPDGNAKAVKGFRMYRLKAGSAILNQLMAIYRDQDYDKDVTGCDFLIERKGSGLDTTYSCTPKPPKAMNANLKAAIPALDVFKNILLEIYEPRVLVQPEITLTPVQQAPVMNAVRMEVAPTVAASSATDDFVF
ncbi:MAG TPA: hypothetical protein VII61_09820 [Ktedonobacteraceae bacterium]